MGGVFYKHEKEKKMKNRIVIIGRPNVGKSTLFNRLVGKRLALVHDMPGMTRDRREADATLYDLEFTIIDTAGLEDPNISILTDAMRQQTLVAMGEANVILFVVDGREGCTPYDQDLAQLLRQQSTPVVVLANKCEGRHGQAGFVDAIGLGIGDVIPISAEHGEGMYDIYEAIEGYFPPRTETDEDAPPSEEEAAKNRPLQLAIVGRPNVGKSTLINTLIGEDRLLTGDMPGVTRDAISLDWVYKDQPIKIIDTAGMRRHGKIDASSERLAVMDTQRTIRYAEVVLMIIDATMPFEKQDLSIARDVVEEGRGLVLALNKWDLIKDKVGLLKQIENTLENQLAQVRGVPCIPISAAQNKNTDRLMDAVLGLYKNWNRRLTTGQLNRWLDFVTTKHPAPAVCGRRIRLKYMTQIKSRPPTFAVFASKASELPESYIRYLANNLRDDFDLPGTPIRIYVRSSDNPYADKDGATGKGKKNTSNRKDAKAPGAKPSGAKSSGAKRPNAKPSNTKRPGK